MHAMGNTEAYQPSVEILGLWDYTQWCDRVLESDNPGGLLAAVAGLEEKVGLQQALLIVPTMYLLSGIGFFFAEKIVASEKRELKAADSFSAR